MRACSIEGPPELSAGIVMVAELDRCACSQATFHAACIGTVCRDDLAIRKFDICKKALVTPQEAPVCQLRQTHQPILKLSGTGPSQGSQVTDVTEAPLGPVRI
jgi:hypothetical protein